MYYILKKFDLPEKRSKISQLHGKLIKARLHYGDIHVVPMYHPAVVLYTASQRETLKRDFEKLKCLFSVSGNFLKNACRGDPMWSPGGRAHWPYGTGIVMARINPCRRTPFR